MSVIAKIDAIGHKSITLGGITVDLYALLANFSTLSNFLLGVYAFIAILFPDALYHGNYIIVRCVVLGASFDAIDGKMARRSNTKPKLGAQFDTGADLFAFGLAPSAMILVMFVSVNVTIAFLFAGIYLFCASFRLSRFMIDSSTSYTGYFKGMPSPPAAIFVAGWYALSNPNLSLAALMILFIAGTMITSYPYTAMKQVATKFQKANFAFTVSIMLLFTYSPNAWMETLGYLWILQVMYFGILGPYHGITTLVRPSE